MCFMWNLSKRIQVLMGIFNLFQIFEANNNRYAVKKNAILESGVVAKYVTLWPTGWVEKLCFRMEIYGKSYLERGATLLFFFFYSTDCFKRIQLSLLSYHSLIQETNFNPAKQLL